MLEVKSCDKCTEALEDECLTQICDRCNLIFHKSCVVINDQVGVWACPQCSTEHGNQLAIPDAPKSTRSKSVISRVSSSSAMELALKEFDNQKLLLDQQAKEKLELITEREKSMKENHSKQQELMSQRLKFIKEMTVLEVKSKSSKSGSNKSISEKSMTSNEKVIKWMKAVPVASGTNNQVDPNQQPSVIHPPVGNSTALPKDVPFSTNTLTREQIAAGPIVRELPIFDSSPNNQVDPNQQPYVIHPPVGNSTAVPKDVQFAANSLTREQIASRHVVRELPIFDGSPERWPMFISTFNRTTKLCGFSNAENLERLGNRLKGSALEAVRSSLTVEENVPRIINTLQMLFGRAEFIINDLLEKLRKEQRPKSENVESIIKFALQVENIAETMKAASLSAYLWNPQLIQELVDKLPVMLKFEWATCKPDGQCSIEHFSFWLSEKSRKFSSILNHAPVFVKNGTDNQMKKGFINLHNTNNCVACHGECSELSSCDQFKSMDIAERWKTIMSHKLCRICLKSHKNKWCDVKKLCGVDACERRHNELLHRIKPSDDAAGNEALFLHCTKARTFYKILPVTLYGPDKIIQTFAMLDDGASLTLLEESLLDELNLTGPEESLCLRWTAEIQRVEESSKRVCLEISNPEPNSKKFKLHARTVKCLNLPSQSVSTENLAKQFEHLANIPIQSFANVKPRLLIGMDHAKLMMMTNHKYGADHEPLAGKCKLGWVIFGSQSSSPSPVYHIHECDCTVNESITLDELIKHHYSLESIGVSTPNQLPMSSEDSRALQILKTTTILKGNKYELGLLWKYDDIKLPPSYNMALRRLVCLEKQCQRTPNLKEMIDQQIKEYILKGYAREASLSDLDVNEQHWYLPIFVVQNPNKPGKFRLVWDAAATVNNVSLNSILLKGIDQIVSLPGIIHRFRERSIGVTGDIKEMYHQVQIRAEDQRFQMFLWRPNPNCKPQVYVMQVMTFGATCSPSCAQHVKNLNAERFRNSHPNAAECIIRNHYVDDMLDSVDDENEALQLCKDVFEVHKEGGFHIRNWVTNSPFVHEHLNASPLHENLKIEIKEEPSTNKVLGLWWNTTKDAFTYTLRYNKANSCILEGNRIPTKREVLRLLMSIFDPLGFLVHRLVFAKILMQKIWKAHTSWDDLIPVSLHDDWLRWIASLREIEQIEIPRWFGISPGVQEIEMHTFCDASEDAFGCVVYLRLTCLDGVVKCALVGGKSRVAPLKMLSIPRMELQAAVLGCRFANSISKELRLPMSRKFFWSDSQTVLNWLHSEHRRYKQFVACRIGELLESSALHEWRWVDSKNNIADLVTKMRLITTNQEEEWINAPSFLHKDHDKWPATMFNTDESEELRPQHYINIHQAEVGVQFENFSCWRRLIRVQAYVMRYIENLKRKVQKQTLTLGPICTDEYVSSELFLFKIAQYDGFPDEIHLLKDGSERVHKKSAIYKEIPYLDDCGVMRGKTRIPETSTMQFDFKRPIILPRGHHITSLLIQFYHKQFHHQNHETVVNELRQRFIIPRLRREHDRVVRNCQYCKNLKAKPNIPTMSELPAVRCTIANRPFTYIGIDYFGPIYVVVKRSKAKRWGVVITCLTTRAVHLEMAYSLSAGSCITVIRNCINRRGKPRLIYSDNGTNFRGASRELREALSQVDNNALAEHFTDSDTEWSFIPPASPHMGGAWERMVRSVKNTLRAIFGIITPTDEVLNSALIEAENIINSRPLTYIPIHSENEEALTPNHFLLGSSNGVKPLLPYDDKGDLTRENWRKIQYIADLFWKRWTREYLPTLTRRTKWFECKRSIQKGDVVVIVSEHSPRNCWIKGRVVEIQPSRDGKVRSATVQTSSGIYKRPVVNLAVLDVLPNGIGTSSDPDEIPEGSVENVEEILSQPTEVAESEIDNRSLTRINTTL